MSLGLIPFFYLSAEFLWTQEAYFSKNYDYVWEIGLYIEAVATTILIAFTIYFYKKT